LYKEARSELSGVSKALEVKSNVGKGIIS